jgi:hypothetical protein
MRHLFICVILVVISRSSLFGQMSNQFIIGVDVLNWKDGGYFTPKTTDWQNLSDLGINLAAITYENENYDYNSYSESESTLDSAAKYGMGILLNRSNWPGNYGQRWQYHPEYSLQYPSGGVGKQMQDNGASTMPEVSSNSNNAWRTIYGTDYPGYIAKGLKTNTDQPDTYGNGNPCTYTVKLRMRLATNPPPNPQSVVTVYVVRVSDGAQISAVIQTNQFTGTDYQEIPVLSFTKSASGPLQVQSQQISLQTVQSTTPTTLGRVVPPQMSGATLFPTVRVSTIPHLT